MQNSRQQRRLQRRPDNAGRLVYANPRNLPSYPSAGLSDDTAAASIAASIGWQHQQEQHQPQPRPDWSALPEALSWPFPTGHPATAPATNSVSLRAATTAASAASAALYQRPSSVASEPPPPAASPTPVVVQPPTASKSSLTAATLAAGSATHRSLRKPQPQKKLRTHHQRTVSGDSAVLQTPSNWGSSAANHAYRTTRHRKSYSVPYPSNHSAYSVLMTPAISANLDTANALTAATAATNGSARAASKRFSSVSETGSVPFTTLGRQMYTAAPPVGSESAEQKRSEFLQASAVAMAKRMYNPNRRSAGADGQGFSSTLQEAAYKLAQERLEKLEAEHQQNRGYRDHYMGGLAPTATASTMTLRTGHAHGRIRLQRRWSSDESEAGMSIAETLEVDENSAFSQRQHDRQAVLAAAQRNVRAKMQSIDEQVYARTGKVRPSMRSSWESKAVRAAKARSDARTAATVPRDNEINLGGGCWMTREEIDRIAAQRVQPLLDEISERAAQERQRQEEQKREEEERKAQGREAKVMHRRKKQAEKAKKAAEKATKARRQSGETVEDEEVVAVVISRDSATIAVVDHQTQSTPTSPTPSSPISSSRLSKMFHRSSKMQLRREGKAVERDPPDDPPTATAATQNTTSPTPERPALSVVTANHQPPLSPSDSSSGSPKDRVKRWIKARFARPRRKSAASASGGLPTATTAPTESTVATNERSFIGGHTLAQSEAAASWADQADWAEQGDRAGSAHQHAQPVQPVQSVQSAHSAQSAQVAQVAQVVQAGEAEQVMTSAVAQDNTSSLADNRSTSQHEVAMAGRPTTAPLNPSAEDITPLAVGTPGSLWAQGAIGAIGAIGDVGTAEPTEAGETDNAPGAATEENGEGASTSEQPPMELSAAEKDERHDSMSPLILPKQIRDPATKKSASPLRDSRFLEDLHETP